MRCGSTYVRSLLSVCWSKHCHATSVRLACFTQCSFVGLTAAAQVSVSEFLKKHEKVFEVVDPRLSLLRLVRKGVIAEGVMSSIDSSNTNDAREVLYHLLEHHAIVDTLKDYCEVAIGVDAYLGGR